VGDSKALPLIGGVMLVLFLPLIIVIALLLGVLTGMSSAAECTPAEPQQSSLALPTDKKEPDQGWVGDGDQQHKGFDYKVDKGSKVYAAESGEVTSTSGDWIKIKHLEGLETWYEFFATKSVKVHDKVDRGQQIGTSGEGDESAPGLSGPHLHFEMWVQTSEGGDLQQTDPGDAFKVEPAGQSSGSCGCGGPLVGSNNQAKAFNYFASNGYSKEQAAGIVGNMIHESGVEPARLQSTPPGTITHASDAKDNSNGWGIVQWTPAGKMIKPSLEAGNDDAKIESLEFQLDFLKKQLDGGTPIGEKNAGDQVKAAQTVDEAAVAFGRYYERFAGSDDLSNPRYTQRKTAAREVLSTFGGGAGGTATGGCGAGNGDIVKTAMGLAWKDRGHGQEKADATKEYQDAMPKYNGATDIYPYSDCGVFVATVMVMSGVDKDYVRRGTGSQRDYVKSSSKYETFDNLNSVDQLQPGDIFVNGGHTFIYTGPYKGSDGKNWNAVSASLGSAAGDGRVPQPSNVEFSDQHGVYTVARIKKK
jgi:murein DD-endopeptidase MepM/ murein hydrolase activator NlpD